jgi:hypothetical protein
MPIPNIQFFDDIDLSLGQHMTEKTSLANMKTKTDSSYLDVERIEQLSNIALIIGVLLVFQWMLMSLYWLGLILLALGTIGILGSQILKKNHAARIVERMTVIGMMIGILGMLQAWHVWLYENGFYLVALSTLGFIIISHVESPENA